MKKLNLASVLLAMVLLQGCGGMKEGVKSAFETGSGCRLKLGKSKAQEVAREMDPGKKKVKTIGGCQWEI